MIKTKQDKYYRPLLYLVKEHGSLLQSCRALDISHQRLSHWNKKKAIPDEWKVYLHKRYKVPYSAFFEQLEIDGRPV